MTGTDPETAFYTSEEKSIETDRTPMEEIFFILYAGTDIPSAYAAGMAGQEYGLQRI